MKIFLSGPMSGLPNFNYPAFDAAAAKLRAMGYEVENPAANPKCDSWEDYMRLALRQLTTCDTVVQLHGWSGSKGARIEYRLAKDLGMRVMGLGDIQNIEALRSLGEAVMADIQKTTDIRDAAMGRVIAAELPLWTCHKQVRAGKIESITRREHGVVYDMVLRLPDNSTVTDSVNVAYMEKHKPEVGGYFVQYEDGYLSFSPCKAFEDGYSLTPNMQPITAEQLDQMWDGEDRRQEDRRKGGVENLADIAEEVYSARTIPLAAINQTGEITKELVRSGRMKGVDIDAIHWTVDPRLAAPTGMSPREPIKVERAPWPFPIGVGSKADK